VTRHGHQWRLTVRPLNLMQTNSSTKEPKERQVAIGKSFGQHPNLDVLGHLGQEVKREHLSSDQQS